MRQKEQLINHGLMRLLLFALVTLMPIGAWAADYSLVINTETRQVFVTDENASDILGDGTMSFNPENYQLTLDGIDLTCSFTAVYGEGSFIECRDWDISTHHLTVHLKGDNNLTLGSYASLFSGKKVTFTAENGNSWLTIKVPNAFNGDLFVSSDSNPVDVTYNSYLYLDHDAANKPNEYTIETLTYPLIATKTENGQRMFFMGYETGNDDEVIHYSIDYVNDNLQDVTNVEFDPSGDYLPLEGPCTMTYYRTAGGGQSETKTAKLFGFETQSVTATLGVPVAPPTIIPAFAYGNLLDIEETSQTAVSPVYNQQTGLISTSAVGQTTCKVELSYYTASYFDYLILNEEVNHKYQFGTFTLTVNEGENYGVTIGGVAVTSANATNVMNALNIDDEPTVVFDPTHNTLTLNGAYITVYSGDVIVSTLDNLTVFLKGDNGITSGDNNAYAFKGNGGTITFETDPNSDGSLEIQAYYENLIFDGITPAYSGGLSMKSDGTPPFLIAYFLSGEGQEGDPYVLSSANDLAYFAHRYNDASNNMSRMCYVELGDNIDCSNMTYFEPIGPYSNYIAFDGYFDGKNKKISNLTYTATNAQPLAGLFGVLGWEDGGSDDKYVKNLVLENCNFTGLNKAGAIAGDFESGQITNCTINNCTVTGTADCTKCGGIAGYVDSGYITGCRVTGTTTVNYEGIEDAQVGAIVGDYDDGAAFTGNYYDYTVTTTITKDADSITKEGYETRGTGFADNNGYYDIFADDGAMLYTKKLDVGNLIAECDYYIPTSETSLLALAPGKTTFIHLYPAAGIKYSAVSLVYDLEGVQITEQLDNLYVGDENTYDCEFVMPDADAELEATELQSYDLWIGNTQVTNANAANVLNDANKTVVFTTSGGETAAPVYNLTLDGATITAPIKVGLPNLTIDIQGNNTITTTATCLQAMDNTTPALTFKSTSENVGSLTITKTLGEVISDISNVTVSKELVALLEHSGSPTGYTSNMYYFTDAISWAQFVPSYGVTVDEIQVFEGNCTDVLGDGKVSFDKASHTLTLNNARIGALATYLSELDIDVIGNNSLVVGSNNPVFKNLDSQKNVLVKVLSSAAEKGCLSLYLYYNDNANSGGSSGFLDTNVTLQAEDPLEIFGDLNATYQANVMIGEDIGDELYVNNIKVVTGNVSNITNNENNEGEPEASYDAATHTLALNRLTMSYMMNNCDNILVQSDIYNLTIKLVGENRLYLGTYPYAVKYTGTTPMPTAPKLTFVSEVENDKYGSLTITGLTDTDNITGYITNGYSINNTLTNQSSASGLIYTIGSDVYYGNYLKLWCQETFGIIVKKDDVTYAVNTANRADVLGDGEPTKNKPGSVQFDGHNRLVLNNADLTSIVVNGTNSLPASGLDIYLEGDSKIDNSSNGYSIEMEGADATMKLSFHTGCDDPGTLVCTNSTPILNKKPFSGFDDRYFNNLSKTIDGNTARVKMPLGLIVDVNDVAIITYDQSPAGSDNDPLDDVAFDDVLYTLNDDGTASSPDGYDQSKHMVVLNTPMTDEQVRNIDTDECIPGTQQYRNLFTGLTFIVPFGTGVITLNNVKTEHGYAIHVMVGYQDPVEVISNDSPSDFEIPYVCSEATFVRIYLVSLDNPAPALASNRIGPKSTVSGGLGGMSVSTSSMVSPPSASEPYMMMGRADWVHTGNHIEVTNNDVTDLADNAFEFASSPAPPMGSNRAGGEHYTYIDASKTKITGKNYSRVEGAFKDVPEETFIFLPAGNTAEGKNFIIGGVCEDMAPLASASEKTFELATDFVAAKADYDRQFTQNTNNDECFTVFLPYAVDIDTSVGQFFTYGGFDGTGVTLNPVAGTKTEANKPYIFKPADTGVLKTAYNAQMKKFTGTKSNPAADTEDEGLHGVYEYYKWTTKPSNIYCYSATDKGGIKAGEFAKVGQDTYIKPFRAYLRINSTTAPEYLSINWGDGTTSIIPLDKEQVHQDADGWYTISGFRLPGKPTEKGIYIHNSKKVVVK